MIQRVVGNNDQVNKITKKITVLIRFMKASVKKKLFLLIGPHKPNIKSYNRLYLFFVLLY